jgi:hypothetical protein
MIQRDHGQALWELTGHNREEVSKPIHFQRFQRYRNYLPGRPTCVCAELQSIHGCRVTTSTVGQHVHCTGSVDMKPCNERPTPGIRVETLKTTAVAKM